MKKKNQKLIYKLVTIILLMPSFPGLCGAEKFAFLPVIAPAEFTTRANQFRSAFISLLTENKRFSPIPDVHLYNNFRVMTNINPGQNNAALMRAGNICGAAKIAYCEFTGSEKSVKYFIKIADTQEQEIVLTLRDISDQQMSTLAINVYAAFINRLPLRAQYLDSVRASGLSESELLRIEKNGGTVFGYALLRSKNIRIEEYIHILLCGGNANEFIRFNNSMSDSTMPDKNKSRNKNNYFTMRNYKLFLQNVYR